LFSSKSGGRRNVSFSADRKGNGLCRGWPKGKRKLSEENPYEKGRGVPLSTARVEMMNLKRKKGEGDAAGRKSSGKGVLRCRRKEILDGGGGLLLRKKKKKRFSKGVTGCPCVLPLQEGMCAFEKKKHSVQGEKTGALRHGHLKSMLARKRPLVGGEKEKGEKKEKTTPRCALCESFGDTPILRIVEKSSK